MVKSSCSSSMSGSGERGEGKEREKMEWLWWWSSSKKVDIDVMKKMSPYACMILAEFFCSSSLVVSKIIFTQGTDPFIYNFYMFLVASSFMAPVSFFFERKTRPPLTFSIICWSFFLALVGVTLCQNLFAASLTYISNTSQSAIFNLCPALTYILSVISRQEQVELHTLRGLGKLFGTSLSLLGTFTMIFWRTNLVGPIDMSLSNLSIGYALATLGVLSLSLWLVLLCGVTKRYPAEFSLTTIMYFFGAIQTFLVALAMNREKGWSEWKLNSTMELQNILMGGVVNCGIGNYILAWCSRKKGPVFVAVFTPLSLLFTAVLEIIILGNTMEVGCIVGSVMIVGGLYLFLWSKSKENALDESKSEDDDEDHKGITSPFLLNQNP